MSDRKPMQVVGWLGNIGYVVVIDKNARNAAEKAQATQKPKALPKESKNR